ncbi:MAG: GntR family transcriptional regulator [Thermodesulfobacteriota bacterium]
MSEIVDFNSPIPRYLQISNWLEEMIRKGRYKVGKRLPSESSLAEICGVNRNTVRQAISELVAKGLISKKNGVGSFISAKDPSSVKYTLQNISSFTDDMLSMGITPETKTLSQKVVEADVGLAEKLMLGGDSRAILTKRLRVGNGIPLVIERSYLPYGEYKSLLGMRLTGSLYHILTEEFGTELHRSIQTFRAVTLAREDALLLGVPPKSPGIFLESIIYDSKNVAVEVLHAHHRGDKYVFQVESGQFHYNVRDVKKPE